jgi:putative DNA primase/helicase
MKPLRELSTEQIQQLSNDEIIKLVVSEIKSSRATGADLEEEHVRLAPTAAARKEIRALWRDEKEWRAAQAKPKSIWLNGRLYPADALKQKEASFILPATQPTEESTGKDNSVRKAIVAKFIQDNRDDLARRKPKEEEPEGEPEVEEEAAPEEEQAGEEWATRTLSDPVILSRRAQFDNAKAFARDKLMLFAKEKKPVSGTYYYGEKWWQWNGAFYEKAPDQRIVDMVCAYLDAAKLRGGEEGLIRFRPTTKDVAAVMTFLRSCAGLDDREVAPIWLDDRTEPRPANLLSFRNWLVDVETGKTYPHEPWLWMHDGVDFDYDPKARCPRWEQFLLELFPQDEEARETIEEQLGYGMTIDNQFEKAALWVGPARSGRGTLAKIQELLVGFNGHTSLNIHTWRSNENSRQGMVGKRVGIFHDMRLKPPKQYGNVGYDSGGVDPQSQQLLLELISGDLTEIGKKFLEAWKGKPFIKFILISNKVPNFNDEVLITRFIVIEFIESWLGRENPELKNTILPSELPGIANRCLAAYRRLCERGRFIQPASGLALLNKVKAQVSPYAAFMDTYWDPDPLGEGTLIKVFNKTFQVWCLQNETEHPDLAGTSKSNLIQQIKKAPGWNWLGATRVNSNPRCYRVKLKPGVTLPDEVHEWMNKLKQLGAWGEGAD